MWRSPKRERKRYAGGGRTAPKRTAGKTDVEQRRAKVGGDDDGGGAQRAGYHVRPEHGAVIIVTGEGAG